MPDNKKQSLIKTLLKVAGFAVVSIALTLALIALAFWIYSNNAPQFGAKVDGEARGFTTLSNYGEKDKNHFINTYQTPDASNPPKLFRTLWNVLARSDETYPDERLATNPLDIPTATQSDFAVTWLSHSSVLLRQGSRTLLIDPVFSDHASPFSWLVERFPGSLPKGVFDLPKVDAVLISHDHYDHLDYDTIKRIDSKVGHYIVPLGVGEHLVKWGVAPDRITELNWWQSTDFEGLDITLTPAFHSSGRTMEGSKSTLWGGYAVRSSTQNAFFSGDSAYTPHFKEIGDRLGPFDLAMIECGQYNTAYPTYHMVPERTYQAAQDVKAAKLLPIHWGGFALSSHGWAEPVIKLLEVKGSTEVLTPQIGKTFDLSEPLPKSQWWTDIKTENQN